MNLELKNLKTWRGMDGIGWQATLYVDGRRAAIVSDEGHGGDIEWEIANPSDDRKSDREDVGFLHSQIDAWVKLNRPPVDLGDGLGSIEMNADLLVAELADEAEERARAARRAKRTRVWL